jgi:hypothetical protein
MRKQRKYTGTEGNRESIQGQREEAIVEQFQKPMGKIASESMHEQIKYGEAEESRENIQEQRGVEKAYRSREKKQ